MRLGRCGDCQFDIRVGNDGVEYAYDNNGQLAGLHSEYCSRGRSRAIERLSDNEVEEEGVSQEASENYAMHLENEPEKGDNQ